MGSTPGLVSLDTSRKIPLGFISRPAGGTIRLIEFCSPFASQVEGNAREGRREAKHFGGANRGGQGEGCCEAHRLRQNA